MEKNARRYLELISRHLQEHHAALFVGSGFSRNADKVTSDVPDIPLWDELANKFNEKLGDYNQNDPLALAENVEIAYGRSELDRILLENIKDANYRPSSLYEKLLRLPWSDVFTTNYDTLLERAGEYPAWSPPAHGSLLPWYQASLPRGHPSDRIRQDAARHEEGGKYSLAEYLAEGR